MINGDVTLTGTNISFNGTLNANDAATAIDGTDAELRLDASGTVTQTGISSGAMDLTVVGGAVTLDQANTYTGDTTVCDGTLTLNRADGAAIVGNLVIGDGSGDAESAIVFCGVETQLASTATVAVLSDGWWMLNDGSQTIAGRTMTGDVTTLASNDDALGTTAGITTVAADATLALSGVTIAEDLEIGSCVGLEFVGAACVLDGNLTFSADVGIEFDPYSYTINGVISGGGRCASTATAC